MKLTNEFYKIISSKKALVYLVITLITGILIMTRSSRTVKTNVTSESVIRNDSTTNKSIYYTNTEEKLKNALKKVDGVGDVEIIINYLSDKNIQDDTSVSKSNKISDLYDENNINQGYNCSQIVGVVVVIEGGENNDIVSTLRSAVSGYLGIPLHKVNILKMK